MTEQLERAIDSAWQLGKLNTLKYLSKKLSQFEQFNSVISKYELLLQMKSESELQSDDYFFKCPSCECTGIETSSLKCPECGVQMYFCSFSGRQIGLIKVKVSEGSKVHRTEYENFRNFNNTECQSKWSQSEEDEFLNHIRENCLRVRKNEGAVQVQNNKTHSMLSLKRTIVLNERNYLYWGRNTTADMVVFCNTCKLMNDPDAFDECCDEKVCPNCDSVEMKSAMNV